MHFERKCNITLNCETIHAVASLVVSASPFEEMQQNVHCVAAFSPCSPMIGVISKQAQ
jgi:hypothetical protein